MWHRSLHADVASVQACSHAVDAGALMCDASQPCHDMQESDKSDAASASSSDAVGNSAAIYISNQLSIPEADGKDRKTAPAPGLSSALNRPGFGVKSCSAVPIFSKLDPMVP